MRHVALCKPALSYTGNRNLTITPLYILLFQVSTVIFDKTGTLTQGTPSVTKVNMFVDEHVCPMNFVLAVVAVVETNSDHPLAYAIINDTKAVSYSLWYTPRYGTHLVIGQRKANHPLP